MHCTLYGVYGVYGLHGYGPSVTFTFTVILRGESFLCLVFSVKSVQNLRTFWRTTQNLLILALLCSLYSKQTFKVHLGVEKQYRKIKKIIIMKVGMLQKC